MSRLQDRAQNLGVVEMSSDKVESKGAQETTHSSSKDEDAKLDDTAGRDSTESSAK